MENIFGCFFKIGFDPNLKENDFQLLADTFRPYIWGENGISDKLKKINRKDFGNDLNLILFEFNVNPTTTELQLIKEIGNYRKSEKAIGIPIVVTIENFFLKNEAERFIFLKKSILSKIELLENIVKKKNLDTNMIQLKTNLENVLEQFGK